VNDSKKIRALRNELFFILLLGANGSGKQLKGEILEALAWGKKLKRLVMSDIIKHHRALKTPLGLKFIEEAGEENRGKLLSSGPVNEAIEREILKGYDAGARIFALDGWPRDPDEQLPAFLSYHAPHKAFVLKLSEEACLRRVHERALKFGPREDDAVALDRFKLQTANIAKMVKRLTRDNPSSVEHISTELPVRQQVMKMLKKVFAPGDVLDMAKMLNDPKHRAYQLINDAEKPHGATARSVTPVEATNEPPPAAHHTEPETAVVTA
jgi:hypothetical protein